MRTDPEERMSARDVYEHRVVAVARRRMEEMYALAKATRGNIFAASPLASVPRGFLSEILGCGDERMDVKG